MPIGSPPSTCFATSAKRGSSINEAMKGVLASIRVVQTLFTFPPNCSRRASSAASNSSEYVLSSSGVRYCRNVRKPKDLKWFICWSVSFTLHPPEFAANIWVLAYGRLQLAYGSSHVRARHR